MAECPALMDDIIKAGARAVVAASVRKPRQATEHFDFEAEKRRKRQILETVADSVSIIVQRVEVGSAVVEMLDKLLVNGKPLGDCTRQELLSEADAATGRASALSEHAAWLRKLAEIVGPNETVRIANREAVVAVLRER